MLALAFAILTSFEAVITMLLRSPVTELPVLERALLVMMSLLQESLAQTKWLDIIRLTGVTGPTGKALVFNDIKQAVQSLSHKGWLTQAAGAGYTLDTRADLSVLFSVYSYFLTAENTRAWIKLAREWINRNHRSYYARQHRSFYRRELWLAMLEGDLVKLAAQNDLYFEAMPDEGKYPLCFMADAADGSALLTRLPTAMQTEVLTNSMLTAIYRLPEVPHLYTAVLSHLAAISDTHELNDLYNWYLLCKGEMLPQSVNSAPAVPYAVMSLLQGDVSKARQQFLEIETYLKKQTGKRKIQFRHFGGWFAVLTQLNDRSNDSHKRLTEQIKTGLKNEDGHCYPLLQALLQQQLHPVEDVQYIKEAAEQGNLPAGLDGLICILALYWLDVLDDNLKQKLLNFRQLLQQRGYLWVAAELDAIISSTYHEDRLWPDWHQTRQLQPLCLLLEKESHWQRALQALNLLATGPVTIEQPKQAQSRLCWFLKLSPYYLKVEPREQKLNAKGQWSAGRAVALKRLSQEQDTLPFVSEHDKKVIISIEPMYQGYYGALSYEINTSKAILHLIGHPLVFWEDKPDTLVKVEAGTFYLQLTPKGNQLELTLQPQAQLHNEENWQLLGPDWLQVFDITQSIRSIDNIIGNGLLVPEAGKEQLLTTLSKLAPQLPVQSDAVTLPTSFETIAPCQTLFLHLSRWQAGLRLQPLMQPLAGGTWFSPGKGNVLLMGEQQGKPVQTERNLKEEQQLLAKLNLHCPMLQQTEFDGTQWLILDPANCLELLEQLQSLPAEQFILVWPEGDPLRISRRADISDFNFSIRQQGQWLELDGELQVDQDQVLSLKELLQLVKNSSSRFIALNDKDYLALSAGFKKQLTELAALPATAHKEGLKVSALTAPIMADIATNAKKVNSNKAWQAQLAKLEQLDTLQPEVPSTLQAELRDYQLAGFQWLAKLAHWGVGACLADDMGLGKTIQTLALLLDRAAGGPALVVAPVSVANNWQTEAARFAPTLKVHWYYDNRDLTALGAFDLVICSYGMLQSDSEQFSNVTWHSVVLDEAQAIKNDNTKRAKAAMALKTDFRLALSGTPIENHLGELWSLFQFLNPGLLGTKEQFAQRFANAIEKGDTQARALLKRLLQPFVLRRTKTQVLSELPSRTEITLAVELSNDERHLYEALRQQAVEQLAQADNGQAIQVLAEIMRLRRFCCNPSLVLPNYNLSSSKLQVFADTLTEILENRHKVLVFSQFVDHLAIVRQYLEQQKVTYQYLDGSTPVVERQKRVTAFQQGEGEVFLISLKAGGSGLNLTAADYVIHLDPWWNPAVEDQASDRAHRIGQTRPVTIYRLVTQNTIEQKILALHQQKRELADSLLEGGDIAARLNTAQLLQLLRAE